MRLVQKNLEQKKCATYWVVLLPKFQVKGAYCWQVWSYEEIQHGGSNTIVENSIIYLHQIQCTRVFRVAGVFTKFTQVKMADAIYTNQPVVLKYGSFQNRCSRFQNRICKILDDRFKMVDAIPETQSMFPNSVYGDFGVA